MADEEIEQVLVHLIDSSLEKRSLAFDDTGKEVGLNAYWDPGDSCWACKDIIDPLSLFLVVKDPEREKRVEDNELVATLVVALKRRPNWVHSFQCGWYGTHNKSGSITGFLLGDKLRRKYFNK